MKPRTPTVRPARRALTLASAMGLTLALALALLPGAAPAGAHEGAGTITVEQVHPAGLSVHYIVMLTWDNDGHPAADATITATAIGPDGTSLTPTTLAPSGAGDGRYSGAVEFPEAGAWTVRFTSIEPTGSAERPEQVAESASTTAGPGDEGSGDSGTGTTQAGVALADDDTGGSAQADESDTSDGGGIPVLLIVAAAVVALGGVVTALLAIRRHRPDLEAAEAAPATAGPDGDDAPGAEGEPAAGAGTGGTPTPEGEPAPQGEPAPGPEGAAPASTEPKAP